jgi:hypothetical protein
MKKLLVCFMGLTTMLSAGVILEVSEGAGPGDPPPPAPFSISALPFTLTLVPGNVGSSNSCEDGGVLNANCWYRNDSGQAWADLSFIFQSDGDDSCGGDVFLGCGINRQGTTTTVRFLGGTIPAGDDFYLVVSGASPGTTVTLALGNEVPEPATWGVVAFALVCCGAVRRRQARLLRRETV